MTKEEIKQNLRANGYCSFHISEYEPAYESAFKKHMITENDSKYKRLMSGIRLDVTNKDLMDDIIISDMYDSDKQSKMYNAGTYENAQKIKDYIRTTHPKEDIFQIWFWNAGDKGMSIENYYASYFEKMARYLYDVEPSQKLKHNAQFTLYNNKCFLQNHKDGKVDGRLCVILAYLNEEYDEANGGLLILNSNEKVLPKIGNIAILDLSKFDIEHQVSEVVGNKNRYCVLSFIGFKNEE